MCLPLFETGRIRPDRAAFALALFAALGVLASGCAPQPHATRTTSEPTQTVKPKPQPQTSDLALGAPRLPKAARKDFTPYHWPDPKRDLWSEIRDGFALPANKTRARVRRWTQFYATHTDHLQSSLKRARPWLYHVVKQVKRDDMPTEIALLPIVESGYNPTAESYAGASGLWQFMPKTAKIMNLDENWWYDGREDPIASTQAALAYLRQLHARYDGSWLLALAAYNGGPGRVDRAIARARRNDQPADYWHLRLPDETSNYVPKLLALRWIMETPAQFGVTWPRLENKPKTQQVKLPGQTELSVAANLLDMPAARLAKLNPDIRHKTSRPKQHARLFVPADKASAFKNKLASIDPSKLVNRTSHRVRRGESLGLIARRNGVSVAALRKANGLSGDRIYPGQRLRIPRSAGERVVQRAAATHRYTVRPGDSLWRIAHDHNTSVAAIRRHNPSLGRTLQVGQTLAITGTAQTPNATKTIIHAGDTLWAIAHRNHVRVADLRRWNHIPSGATLRPGQKIAIDGPAPLPDYYRVESGDSLWSIASHFSMTVATLRRLNDLSKGSPIRPGQRLRLQPSVSAG